MEKVIKTVEERFAERLLELRAKTGMKQTDLAKAMGGIAAGTISGYEKGLRTASIFTLEQAANVFNVTCDSMLGRRVDKGTQAIELAYEKGKADAKKEIWDLIREKCGVFD